MHSSKISASTVSLTLRRMRSAPVLVLVLATVLATTLRIVGLTWGLPASLHHDEWVVVEGAIGMAQRNSFEPALFMRPDHVEIKLSYLVYAVIAHLGFQTSIEAAYAADPSVFLLASRTVTAVFGIAQVPLAYAIGRRISPAVGAVAATLFAIFPPFVDHSHYATPDVPITTMLLVVTYACMKYLERPTLTSLIAGCVGVALSIAIKYPGAIASVMIAIVVIWAASRDRRPFRIVTHGLVAVVSVVAGLFVISPTLFTNVSGVIAAIRQESRSTHAGADGLGFVGNLSFYAADFLNAAGILVVIFAVIGLYAAIRHRLALTIPFLIGVIFWIAISALPLHWARWGLPMYISPLLAASVGAYYSYRWLDRPRLKRALPFAAATVGGVVVLHMSLSATVISARLEAPDTRLEAQADLAERGVRPDNSVWEGYTPFQPGTSGTIFDEFATVNGRPAALESRVEYVVLSSCMNQRYLNDPKFEDEQAFYRELAARSDLVVSYDYLRPRATTWFEPASIAASAGTLADLAGGAMNGCDIDVYELTSVDPEA